MGVDDDGQWPRTQPPRQDWPYGESATERMGGPGTAGQGADPSPTAAGGDLTGLGNNSPFLDPPGGATGPKSGVAPTQSMAGLDPPRVSDAVPPGGRPPPTARMPGTPPHGQAPSAASVAPTQAFAPAPAPPAYPPQQPHPGAYQQRPPSPYQAPPGRGPAPQGPPRPVGPPPQRPPAAGGGRSGAGGSSPLNMPFIGVVIAVIGLGVLWVATHSEPWIESGATSINLSELQDLADFSESFKLVSWYADVGWTLLFAYVAYVAVIATLLNFKSRAARTVLWLPVTGLFTFFNLADRSGTVAPRVLGVLAMAAPVALMIGVWVDLRVQPEFNDGAIPQNVDIDDPDLAAQGFDPDNPDDLAAQGVDPEQAEALQEAAAGGSVDLATLEDLGLEWEGFSNDDIGNGLWLTFGAAGVVAVGALVGTRKTS